MLTLLMLYGLIGFRSVKARKVIKGLSVPRALKGQQVPQENKGLQDSKVLKEKK